MMKINKKYYLVAVAFVVIVAIAFFLLKDEYVQPERDFSEITKDGVLQVVTDYNSVGYFVSGDTMAGLNHDLLQLLQTYTSLKIEVSLENSLEKSIKQLNAGKYDIIARNISITSELRDSLSFTEPITQNKLILIQRKKMYNDGREPIRSLLDLAGATLYLPKGSPAMLRVNNLSHEIGDTIYYVEDPLYGAEQLAMKVASNEIDYAICDEKNIKKIVKNLPEIDTKTYIGFTHFEAWAVRSNSPVLLDSLNTWIQQIKATKEYNRLLLKYYK